MKNRKVFIFNLISILCLFSFLSCKAEIETINECTISYISEEGQTYNKKKTVPSGYILQKVDLFDLSADGYEFLGWFNKGAKVAVGDKITEDLVFTAKWKEEDTTPPSEVVITNITAKNGKATITWTNPTDSDFKGVELSATPNEGTLTKPITLGNDVTSFTVSELKNNSTYTFKIRTYDTTSNYSKGVISDPITVEESSDKTPPSEVVITNITAKNGKATITWTNPTDSDFKGVELSATPNEGTLTNPIILNKETTSFEVNNLTDGKKYTLKIRTIDTSLNYSIGVTKEVTPEKTYTVTFNVNGHGNTPSKIIDIKKEGKITPPSDFTPTDKFTFEGWYKDSSCNTLWDFNTDTVTDDITLYAKWRKSAIGDVILNNGLFVSPDIIIDSQKDKAIAVVCGFNSKQAPLGIGVQLPNHSSDRPLEIDSLLMWYWKDNNDPIYNMAFPNIYCTPSATEEGAADTATFEGDIDGSDNWMEIYNKDPNCNPLNYELFNWANNYGTTYSLPNAYKDGWYIPSIKELTDIYRNKAKLNEVLSKLQCTELDLKNDYWSSSQAKPTEDNTTNNSAWTLNFSTGKFEQTLKDTNCSSRCIRAF